MNNKKEKKKKNSCHDRASNGKCYNIKQKRGNRMYWLQLGEKYVFVWTKTRKMRVTGSAWILENAFL
jgi:hypothetical protein